MTETTVSAPVLSWAWRRSGRGADEIRTKFVHWDDWVEQKRQLSFSDVQKIADFTRVPIGYFFLPDPPVEELPIPDFRAGRGERTEASGDLLETIYLNQRRQGRYEDYLANLGELDPLPFVGSAARMPSAEAAARITESLGYSVAQRKKFHGVDEARAFLIAAFEERGGLVVLNSMVANNTHRMLDRDEFRGFTLQSQFAPLVFVNANDTKNGQIFSLLHEFAHVWRGESGVSQGGDPLRDRATEHERWCDAVAAEVAVPATDLKAVFDPGMELTAELTRLSARYWCSTLVILLRLKETSLVPSAGFVEVYENELDRLLAILGEAKRSGGGDFYNNQTFRVGKKLGQAIIRDTLIGSTPMTEALRLLAFGRIAMFDTYAARMSEV